MDNKKGREEYNCEKCGFRTFDKFLFLAHEKFNNCFEWNLDYLYKNFDLEQLILERNNMRKNINKKKKVYNYLNKKIEYLEEQKENEQYEM